MFTLELLFQEDDPSALGIGIAVGSGARMRQRRSRRTPSANGRTSWGGCRAGHTDPRNQSLEEVETQNGDLLLSRESLPDFLGHGKPPLEIVAYSSRRFVPFRLKQNLAAAIERDVVLPNHDKLVSLIERNLHLAEADEKLEGFLLAYMRHVAIYRSIRAAGEEMVLPMAAGEEWPHDLFPSVERRMRELQEDYNRLLRAQEKAGSGAV